MLGAWWKAISSDIGNVAEFRRWLFGAIALVGGLLAGVHGVPDAVHGSENQDTLVHEINDLRANVVTELYLARKRLELDASGPVSKDTSQMGYAGYDTVETQQVLNGLSASIERLYGQTVSDAFDSEVGAWVYDTIGHLELEQQTHGKAAMPLDDLREIEKLCDNRLSWWQHYLLARERRWHAHRSFDSRKEEEAMEILVSSSPRALKVNPDQFFTWLRKQKKTSGFDDYLFAGPVKP